MALHGRYTPSQLRHVLAANNKLTSKGNRPIAGNITAPAYYENEHALILDAATDTINPRAQLIQTITDAFQSINGLSPAEKAKKIIIPVAEEQKILGLFPRNHWITLYYDPQTNKATVLDSRPWMVSFLYPTSSMRTQLLDGIKQVYGETKAQGTQFEIRYQGVQHNDIHCGAWTARNIMDLAGARANETCNSIEQQVVAYTKENEASVVQGNTDLAAPRTSCRNVHERAVTPGLWARFLSFIGIHISQDRPIPPNSADPELTSPARAIKGLNAHPVDGLKSRNKAEDGQLQDAAAQIPQNPPVPGRSTQPGDYPIPTSVPSSRLTPF
ncbi:hypothetical protein [Legionella worsleiensis]|uniref:Ubiquitin-like protease family profile domain-containing protein n=1 Tax=Legionella worsleiensis TaxID=45076 RepID=A0A0W1A631_9GAMM|nr:hypothetical protein [Legionella worsleiensis]KTD76794.1 hypothetical protein Lwor_2019 [Legionella worsleiensis]STY30629.1 Uncharacterised protein [Legionella worsleiensis]